MRNLETNTLTGRAAAGLVANLRESIVSGNIAVGEFLPSVRVLSAEQGLAPQTVHRALKCLAAEKLIVAEPRQGYRVLPRAAAASAAAPVACIVDMDEGGGTWGRTLSAVFERAAGLRGVSMLAVPFRRGSTPGIREQLRAARPRGVLLNTAHLEVLDVVAHSGVPAVMFDSWQPASGFDAVIQDAFEGAMQAAEHLARGGHTEVAWLGYETAGGGPQIIERYSGAVGGLAHAGLELRSELRAEVVPDNAELAREAAMKLLSRSPRPTAAMALWYPLMQGLLAAAAELGLETGKDFEMVGWTPEEHYDADYRPLFSGRPPAPAIVWKLSELVETAMKRLEERIANPAMTPLQLKIPTRLRVPRSRRG